MTSSGAEMSLVCASLQNNNCISNLLVEDFNFIQFYDISYKLVICFET